MIGRVLFGQDSPDTQIEICNRNLVKMRSCTLSFILLVLSKQGHALFWPFSSKSMARASSNSFLQQGLSDDGKLDIFCENRHDARDREDGVELLCNEMSELLLRQMYEKIPKGNRLRRHMNSRTRL